MTTKRRSAKTVGPAKKAVRGRPRSTTKASTSTSTGTTAATHTSKVAAAPEKNKRTINHRSNPRMRARTADHVATHNDPYTNVRAANSTLERMHAGVKKRQTKELMHDSHSPMSGEGGEHSDDGDGDNEEEEEDDDEDVQIVKRELAKVLAQKKKSKPVSDTVLRKDSTQKSNFEMELTKILQSIAKKEATALDTSIVEMKEAMMDRDVVIKKAFASIADSYKAINKAVGFVQAKEKVVKKNSVNLKRRYAQFQDQCIHLNNKHVDLEVSNFETQKRVELNKKMKKIGALVNEAIMQA